MIKATSTPLHKILELFFYYLGILMLATNYCGIGAKEDPELVISFQLTFIQLEYDPCTKLKTPNKPY